VSYPSPIETFFRTHGLFFLAGLLLAAHWLDDADRFHRTQLLGHYRTFHRDSSTRPPQADALYRILRGTPVERPVRTVVRIGAPATGPITVIDS
jgi:hypothetical protein